MPNLKKTASGSQRVNNFLLFVVATIVSPVVFAGGTSCDSWMQETLQKRGYAVVDLSDKKSMMNFLWSYQKTSSSGEDVVSDYVAAKKMSMVPKLTAELIFLRKAKMGKFEDGFPRDQKRGATYVNSDENHDGVEIDPTCSIEAIQNSALDYSSKKSKLEACYLAKQIISGTVAPIKIPEFFEMLVNVMEEENSKGGMKTTSGDPTMLKWSPEFKNHCSTRQFGMLPVSKLFIGLATGELSTFMISGVELEFRKWIEAQAERSISPKELFATSYRMNRGDLFLTLLTVENVLSRYWHAPNRENLVQTRKLMPLANFYGDRGDHYGTWYHFFGTILYTYVNGGFLGKLSTIAESALSQASDLQLKSQKRSVGIAGVQIGKRLREFIRSGGQTFYGSERSQDFEDPNSYLQRQTEYDLKSREFKEMILSVRGQVVDLKPQVTNLGICDLKIEMRDGNENVKTFSFKDLKFNLNATTSVLLPKLSGTFGADGSFSLRSIRATVTNCKESQDVAQ